MTTKTKSVSVRTYQKRVKELIDALKSGDYEQGRSALKSNGRYCCLGVACEISGLGTFNKTYSDIETFTCNKSKSENSICLPKEVQVYYGFKNDNGHIIDLMSLMSLNDDGVSFCNIANIIDSCRKQLFIWAK